MKKNLAIVTCVALAACVASVGCKKKAPDASAGDSKTITLWEQEDANVAPVMDQIFRAFEALPENAGVKISRVHYGNEELRQQFQTASMAGKSADLVMSPPDVAGVYSVSGFIQPVNQLVDLSKYQADAVGAATLGGKTWGVPVSRGNHLMMFFNKKLVKKVPQDTKELFAFCDAFIKSKPGSPCMAFDIGEPFWLMPWLAGFGGAPVNEKTPTLNTPAMQKAVEFYVQLQTKKYVPGECDYNCADSLFKEGKVPFIVNGDWTLGVYSKAMGADLGIARMPKISETGLWPAPLVSGKHFMVASAVQGAKLELVKKLLVFYTNQQNQVQQLKATSRLPSLIEASNAPEIAADALLKASLDQLSVGKPMPMATEMRAVWDAIRPALRNVLTKKAPVAEQVKAMQDEAVKKIAEMK